MNFDVNDAIKWLETMQKKIEQHREYLSALDKEIGDGDHGENMASGFNAISKRINDKTGDFKTISDVFKMSANTLMTTIGGAATILYATAFLQFAKTLKDKQIVTSSTFYEALQEALASMKYRGSSKVGDKTLIDVWEAVAGLFETSEAFPEGQMIETVAAEAMEGTRLQVARRGKAALYNDKSVGVIDPGAASSFYLFSALAEVIEEGYHE